MSHTPGPWSVKVDGRFGYLIQEDETGYEIATVFHDTKIDSAANANLVIAAPSLFSALTDLLGIVADCHGLHGPEVENAQRLIDLVELGRSYPPARRIRPAKSERA